MPFIPDAEFQRKDKLDEIKKQIMKKQEQALINDKAKLERENKKPFKMDNAKVIKEVLRQTNKNKEKEPKPLSIKDLQNAMKMDKFIEATNQEELEQLMNNEEIVEVKNEFVNVLALPHTNPVKRQIFANKLQQSTTINNYVNNNILLRMFNKANENLKFSVVYGMKYVQTNSDYERLLMIQKLQQEQALKDKLKETVKEEKKEEIKEETKEESSDDEEEDDKK